MTKKDNDKTSVVDVLRKGTTLPTWLVLVLVFGVSTVSNFAGGAIGVPEPTPETIEASEIVHIAEEVEENAEDIEGLQQGLGVMRDNQLLICQALDVKCER